MKTYDRFLFSLLMEFKHSAQSHIQSLWINWLELEGATDDEARSAAAQRALRRIRTLRQAADAINAHHARACSRVLERRLITLTRGPAAAAPESFAALYQATHKLAEALYSIDREASTSEHVRQPTEKALVPFYAD